MDWKSELENILSESQGEKITIWNYSYVGGGSINETFQISTSIGTLFVKKNSASQYPEMFQREAAGIKILSEANEIDVPKVITFGEGTRDAFLILEFIEAEGRKKDFWSDFARKLGNLHRHSADYFGLEHDNYIGSLPQHNRKHHTWIDFFREERLSVQVKMAMDSGAMGSGEVRLMEKFYSRMDNIFPVEPPSLIHGDLWGGNFMVNAMGEPVIIDPAVYYGNREMDLGMSKLFGGFNSSFYKYYNQYFPLEKGWEERLDYCNLYPLMVHVNLFGGGYMNSVLLILKRFR